MIKLASEAHLGQTGKGDDSLIIDAQLRQAYSLI